MRVLLPGGMDSSLITGLLAETGTPDLRTNAIGFETVGGRRWTSPLAANTDADGGVIAYRRGSERFVDLLFPFMARCHARAYQPLPEIFRTEP